MALRIDLTCPTQRLAWEALQPGNTVCIPWGRGGGKSYFDRQYAYFMVATMDGQTRPGIDGTGVRIAVLMPTLAQARKVHQRLLIAELTGSGRWAWLGGAINKTELRVDFPGGSWIQFVSAETALVSARGIRADIAIVDECDDVDVPVYDAIIRPWFTEPASLSIKLLSGTPKRGRYGLLYRTHMRGIGKLLDKRGQRFARHHSFHATCYAFPKFVSAREIEEAKQDPALAQIFPREYLCSFDAGEGLVYPMFSESFHVREPDSATVWTEVLVGVDHGYEDPGCIYVIGVQGSGADATAHVIHEVYRSRQLDDWWLEQARQVIGWFPQARWFIDPSRPDKVAAFKRAGARIGEVDNSIEPGVAIVANLLAVRDRERAPQFARLYVSPACPNLIREFGLYRRRRDPKNTESVLDDIEDKNNHAMDALRYPLLARFRTKASSGRNERGAEQRQ